MKEKNTMRSVQPEIVTTDYEQAMRLAARKVWPGVSTPGCTFHFRQALLRNISKKVKKITLTAGRNGVHSNIFKKIKFTSKRY